MQLHTQQLRANGHGSMQNGMKTWVQHVHHATTTSMQWRLHHPASCSAASTLSVTRAMASRPCRTAAMHAQCQSQLRLSVSSHFDTIRRSVAKAAHNRSGQVLRTCIGASISSSQHETSVHAGYGHMDVSTSVGGRTLRAMRSTTCHASSTNMEPGTSSDDMGPSNASASLFDPERLTCESCMLAYVAK